MSKYHNTKTKLDGITFDSHAEAMYYLRLKDMWDHKEIVSFEVHPKFVLQDGFWKCNECGEVWSVLLKGKCQFCNKKLPKTKAITYEADFLVNLKNGGIEIIDVKGMETEAFKLKKKMFEYKYPKYTLKVVKNGR